MHFPPELYRLIIRDATYVPGALDTSYEAIVHEDRESIQAAITASLGVKCSLCLVSKAFHDLTMEYLYEIITFRRYHYIPRVVESLRTNHNGKLPGMWCRRLDLGLGQDNNDYAGEDWEGSDILWGLIPACPNLTVLMFHGYYITHILRRNTRRARLIGPLVPSVKLWKIMATIWAPSLRRIEMSGIWMRSDRFEQFIRYFTHLQACRITTIELFDPTTQAFDGDEPPTYEPATNCLRPGRIPKGVQSMDADAVSLLRRNQEIAEWPSYDGDQSYLLPSLHTLHLDSFPDSLSRFQLPNVRFLGAYNLLHRKSPDRFYSALAHVSPAFSSSLTRFTCGSESPVDFIRIFDAFPHLTDLKVLVNSGTYEPSPLSKPPHPQTTLKHLFIIELSNSRLGGVREILSVVRSGIFHTLEKISVICRDERLSEVRASVRSYGLASMGVSVNVSSDMVSIMPILPRFPVYP